MLPDGSVQAVIYGFDGGWVPVAAQAISLDPDGSGVIDVTPLSEAQLTEIATDPGLRRR